MRKPRPLTCRPHPLTWKLCRMETLTSIRALSFHIFSVFRFRPIPWATGWGGERGEGRGGEGREGGAA